MAEREPHETALALVSEGKGILAADEDADTIGRRFEAIGVACTTESRRAYRELLLATPDLERYISGVILCDETIRQQALDGTPFPELLRAKGIIPGITVDKGPRPLALSSGETVTEGLDGLRERLAEYRRLGARFAKWRAPFTLTKTLPSEACVSANAHALARYAALAQEAALVPIVEPDVLMDGAQPIERSYEATGLVLDALYTALTDQRVELEATLLKPNMVLSGYHASPRAGIEEVAEWTLRCLRERVPVAVPGIVFLSGGQPDLDATAHLNAMNARGPHPWALSFSYARALQGPALKAWAGRAENLEAAQRALQHRAKMNGAARAGAYTPAMEDEALPV